jgi:hypothetical protein
MKKTRIVDLLALVWVTGWIWRIARKPHDYESYRRRCPDRTARPPGGGGHP